MSVYIGEKLKKKTFKKIIFTQTKHQFLKNIVLKLTPHLTANFSQLFAEYFCSAVLRTREANKCGR